MPVGEIKVQHITVGDKCFWAGEKQGKYILHHNMKFSGPINGNPEMPPIYGENMIVNPSQELAAIIGTNYSNLA
jgi:hypothetical protein